MSETFKASNGVELDEYGEWACGNMRSTEEEENAARIEFYQHLRDKELGRWRWPENPDVVVKAYDGGERARVTNERNPHITGNVWRADLDCSMADEQVVAAASAYFAAHPEQKPWHDSVEGEVWLLMFPNSTQAWFVNGDYFQSVKTLTNINKTDPGITAGRRIWPEVSDA